MGVGARLNRLSESCDASQPARRRPWRIGPIARPNGGGEVFIAAVTQVSGALRSGVPPSDAWWRGMGVRAEGGIPTWADLSERWPTEATSARAVLAAARLSADVGAAPATVLDRMARALAQDAEAQTQRRAALAGPRATARVLAWLPVLGLVLGVALGADPFAVLLDGTGGTALLAAGVLLTWAGRRWTGRYLRAAADAGRAR